MLVTVHGGTISSHCMQYAYLVNVMHWLRLTYIQHQQSLSLSVFLLDTSVVDWVIITVITSVSWLWCQ